jgi:2-methylisocitrate lyase-like PEP mutase family enzyme
MRTARKAIDDSRQDVLLVGRAEGFLVGRPDLDDVIRRLKAYADAGADVLYAPLIKTREQIEAVVRAVAPKPVNFLNSANFGFSVDDLAAMGVRRISVGGSLARVAWTAFTQSATEIAAHGTFKSFEGTMSNAELNAFFADDQTKRRS